MSQYSGYTRTSYFHVIDEAAFRALIAEVVTSEDAEIYIWKGKDDEGKDTFAFGCYSDIRGIRPADSNPDIDNEPDYERFIEKLQECLVDGDAVIITEVGHEKLNYLTAQAAIVGKHKRKYIDFHDVTVEMVHEVEPNWPEATRLDY